MQSSKLTHTPRHSRNFPNQGNELFFERRILPLQPSSTSCWCRCYLNHTIQFTFTRSSLNLFSLERVVFRGWKGNVEWVQGEEKAEKKELSLFNPPHYPITTSSIFFFSSLAFIIYSLAFAYTYISVDISFNWFWLLLKLFFFLNFRFSSPIIIIILYST